MVGLMYRGFLIYGKEFLVPSEKIRLYTFIDTFPLTA